VRPILSGVPRAHTVLLVEDDTDLRRMFRMALAFAGFRVLEAGNGLHALRVADAETLDLVVLDLGLPIISGEVVRQELAIQTATRDLPVIVVTARSGPYEGLDAKCILVKPVTSDRLVDAVRGCLPAVSG
jgi:two-component system, OmpR family, KDP operon response regulator KdpE